MKKVVATLLVLAMILGIAPAVLADDAPELITITAFKGAAFDQPTDDNKIFKKIEEDFGIKFEWEFLAGDLAAYTEVLQKANPLGELTDFADSIRMQAQSPDRLESSFVCNGGLMEQNRKLYLAAMGLRIARDLLACLPVDEVTVTGEDDGGEVFSATYTRQQLLHRNFAFVDPVALAKESGAEFK